MACTKKKQCLYGDICPTARNNEYNLINASCYKPLEQTNEEWFCKLNTSDKAEFIATKCFWSYSAGFRGKLETEYASGEYWDSWLKAMHKE